MAEHRFGAIARLLARRRLLQCFMQLLVALAWTQLQLKKPSLH
jgi:hypothetical protein